MRVTIKPVWAVAVICSSLFFLSTTHLVGAQSLGGISLTSSPKYPEPEEEVVVSLDQYGVNTFGSTIRWYVDGVEQTDARNERSVSFSAGDLGENTTVRVSITQSNGAALTSTKVITPTLVDMILEADTYVPYFYKGRALPSSDASVRIIALVHGGNATERASYSYKWQLGTSVLFGGVVKGKYVAELTMPQFDRKPLSVEVSDSSGNIIAKNSLVLTNQEPELVFYEENALRGHLERAVLDELSMLGEETTIYGEPYYLSRGPFDLDTNFSWKINGQNTTPNTTPNSITLQKTGLGGFADIDLEVATEKDVPQLVRNSFRLVF